jgi:two-component system, OmpR family, KDP operon response regulator KdpE
VSAVLLVEDDRVLRRVLRASFRNWNFDVAEAGSGEEALTMVSGGAPDLVVLDLSLPGIDGLETLRHLRTFTEVPVMVLTVRDSLRDKLSALDSGADDYVTKPFEPAELIARARAHLRRGTSKQQQEAFVRIGDLAIDLTRQRVTWRGELVRLTPTEMRLLEVLLANRGRLMTRERLLEEVWGSRSPSDRGRLRVFVLHLRRKLHDDAALPRLILTEPGLGYRWVGDDEILDEP